MFKKYILGGTLLVSLILGISTYILYNRSVALQEKLYISVANEKAYMSENDSLKEKGRVLQYTLDQLNYYNDSLLDKIQQVKRDLKIKDRDIQQLQYLLSEANKVDTVIITDTIFKNPKLNLDTIFGNEWYTMKLGLRYPGTIITQPTFKSEKVVIISSGKETVDPPKKCWLLRLFQKKHTVVKVDIKENNPYIQIKDQRFIKIIK